MQKKWKIRSGSPTWSTIEKVRYVWTTTNQLLYVSVTWFREHTAHRNSNNDTPWHWLFLFLVFCLSVFLASCLKSLSVCVQKLSLLINFIILDPTFSTHIPQYPCVRTQNIMASFVPPEEEEGSMDFLRGEIKTQDPRTIRIQEPPSVVHQISAFLTQRQKCD